MTAEELRAVQHSVTQSIKLYTGYLRLRPEDIRMKRNQGRAKLRLDLLRSALRELKGSKESSGPKCHCGRIHPDWLK
jgi:hypothetical protein